MVESHDSVPEDPSDSVPGVRAASEVLSELAGSGRNEPLTVVVRTAGTGWVTRTMTFLGWVGFAVCAVLLVGQYSALSDYFDISEGITEKYHSGAKYGRDKIAVISVSGVIMTGEGFLKRQIDRVKQDKSVKAVVLRVESPGGTVTGADYMLHHLKKLRDERELPIVVSMGSIAASGGYYVSMVVGDVKESIFAEPTTTTGSIGVIIPHYDISGLLDRFDIKDDSVATHPRKEILSMTKPMPDDHRQILQDYINEAFGRFKDVVKEGRPIFKRDGAALDELATGQVYTALQAKANGLVDRIGFIEDAIERACELASLDIAQTRVIQFERPYSLFDLGFVQAPTSTSHLEQLMEMGTPRAYYLWSAFPPLVTTNER